MSEEGRFPVDGRWLPLQLTTACWFNKWKDGEYKKAIAAHGTGWYSTVKYGSHNPPPRRQPGLQIAKIDTVRTGTFTIDVDQLHGRDSHYFLAYDQEGNCLGPDRPVEYEPGYLDTRTGQLLGPEHATVVRNAALGRFHIYIDARAVPLTDFPPRKPIFGADIIVNGFVPYPGSRHYSGDIYKTARVPLYVVWPWPELIAAIRADQADYARSPGRSRGGGGGGGYGGGGDGEPVDIAALAEHGLPTGGRNNTLLSAACSLFRKYGTTPAGEAAVRAALGPVLQRTELAGFSEREIEGVIGRARQFIAAQERLEREALESLGVIR